MKRNVQIQYFLSENKVKDQNISDKLSIHVYTTKAMSLKQGY